ncbi:MAG: restriction endonuclease subunit S [Hydrogenophaga sp.]|nr:restriction endonuclease subunit S [Hydrogenophaga sp.]
MVNMGELFAHPRIKDIAMDLVPLDKKEFHYLLEAGDLLFARQSLVLSGAGQCSIFLCNKEPTVFESHLIRCRLNTLASNPLFYFYFFRSPDGRKAIEAIVEQGAGASGIRGSDLVNLQVPNPRKQTQDEIAEVMGALDDRITLLRETNASLEAIAQALFKSWFFDFDPVHAKMEGRAPEGMDEATAALFPDTFEETELGAVPKGWRVTAVEDFAERVGMGPFGSNIKVETFVESGVPVISGQHLKQSLVEDNTSNFITPEHAQRLAKSCVHAGDVIFTHAGSIGQVSLLHRDAAFSSYVLSQRQFFLRCNRELMSPEWVMHYFKSPIGQHQLLANTSQVGVPSIARPVTYLRSIRLVVPPPELNQRFASLAGSINDCVMANRKQLTSLVAIRDSLLPRLISGQLRLAEAAEALEAV